MRVSVAEGEGLCALGEGCCGDGGGWRAHLLLRVQSRAPWVRIGVLLGPVSVGICCRGCKVVHPRRGIGAAMGQLAWASVAEGAMLCSLDAGWMG